MSEAPSDSGSGYMYPDPQSVVLVVIADRLSAALARGDDMGDTAGAAAVGLTLVGLLALLVVVGAALASGVPSAERWLLRAELHGTCTESVSALRLERRLQRARHGGEGGKSGNSGGVCGDNNIHVEEIVPIVPCDGV